MKNAFSEIYTGLKSLLIGMRITIGEFFKPQVTVHYPYETLKIPPRYRGHIELVRDPATGLTKCIVCKLCEKACPSDCITVEGIKPEGAKRKRATTYRLDFTKCSLCGSCVEVCRDQAIRFSREYNLAGLSKEDFIMDLVKRLDAEVQGPGFKVQRQEPGAGSPEPGVGGQKAEVLKDSARAAASSSQPSAPGIGRAGADGAAKAGVPDALKGAPVASPVDGRAAPQAAAAGGTEPAQPLPRTEAVKVEAG